MEQQGLQLSDLYTLAPELTLVIAAIVISLIDLFIPKQVNRSLLGWLTLASIIVSGVFVSLQIGPTSLIDPANPESGELLNLLGGSYRVDNFANLLKLILLGSTGLIILMSIGSVKEEDIPHKGEFYYFFLPAVLGAMITASSGDLITLFVGLELLSITSYIMVGMRKKDHKSNEGAFKYAILGAVSSATILYGMSFLYGMSGSTNLMAINAALQQADPSFSALIYVSFFLLLAGFGFKIAAAPFHNWAPDVYQGAPTPVTAFLAVVSKAAGFAILFRVMYGVFYGNSGTPEHPIGEDAFFSLSVLAAIAMIIGNVTALRQKNAKRLLAYSGIANAGYLLVPIATQFSLVHYTNFSEFAYYLLAYALMNIGAFAVLLIIERSTGSSEIRGYAGLYYRAPWTAAAMVLLILSLAGIPVTGGFFGKLFILMGTLQNQTYWLAAIMLATSVVSYYFYFSIIRQMFMRSDESSPIRTTPTLGITIWICTIGTVAMGAYPQGVLGWIQDMFKLTRDLFIG
ncbi:NADH-quinone oxidoreductase subunit N [Paenibacillus contaminans]|uniref:NADH-quinone oxidoreductase subunit N n=1 Tax=Paenibacillus contaminans TaxID=450362 RepID=A0A329MBS6_9BACL|nr:NADH-quinone oxidoreductase subunit N [Paenibacillus contaminans]RAV17364.1 NADH-quinone oxidoreductase subunit N [Paenibacillus contaminans]